MNTLTTRNGGLQPSSQPRNATRLAGICVVTLGSLALLAASPAFAQQAGASSSDAPYTLNEALRDALARDPRIRAAGSRVQEAGEEFAEARSLRFPNVSLTGGRGYGYNRNEARNIGIYEGDSLSRA